MTTEFTPPQKKSDENQTREIEQAQPPKTRPSTSPFERDEEELRFDVSPSEDPYSPNYDPD